MKAIQFHNRLDNSDLACLSPDDATSGRMTIRIGGDTIYLDRDNADNLHAFLRRALDQDGHEGWLRIPTEVTASAEGSDRVFAMDNGNDAIMSMSMEHESVLLDAAAVESLMRIAGEAIGA